jgi:hypothetical protein
MIGNLILVPYLDSQNNPEDAATMANFVAQGYKFVMVTEDTGWLDSIPYAVPASILLPPYEAMSELIDDNSELAYIIYHNYVYSYEVFHYLILIMGALVFNQNNLAIMFDRDAYELKIVEWLGTIIAETFGIRWATYYSPMQVDEVFARDTTSHYMFQRGMIDCNEFIMRHASNQFTADDIALMCSQMRPCINGPLCLNNQQDLSRLGQYFSDLKCDSDMKGKILIDPIEKLSN